MIDKPGLLLINLGTPDAPHAGPVRRYLREFLGDGRVIDINPVGRKALLEFVILPTRPAKSAEAYEKIWTPEGSPLLVHGRALEAAVRKALEGELEVELAMRYGNPSITAGLKALQSRGVTRVTVFPLYPQYAASTTASSLDEVLRVMRESWDLMPLSVVPAFYDDPLYVDAFAEVAAPVLRESRADHVLFSYHGVPERQIQKSDPNGPGVHCLASATCCDSIGPVNHRCYRAQCFATTRALVKRLGLSEDGHSISFQSRLGRTPWIRPYTDEVLKGLAERGVKRLAVTVPSFVADCLETLEEIAMRGKEDFVAAGGEDLILVPSLNSHEHWVRCVVALARRNTPPIAA